LLLADPSPYDPQTRNEIMASLSPVARFAIKLYFRCRLFNEIALPEEGGILDQSEMMVAMLEAVHTNVMEMRERKMNQINRPSPNNIQGIDPKVTEGVSIGKTYRRVKR